MSRTTFHRNIERYQENFDQDQIKVISSMFLALSLEPKIALLVAVHLGQRGRF